MEMYEYIKFSHFKLGHSIRKIHRTTGLDRKTIRKAVMGITPAYRLQQARKKTVIGPYLLHIRNWLHQDKRVPKKQRHTATRIHNRLRNEYGYTGSKTTTSTTVRQLREEMDISRKEVFIPSDPEKVKLFVFPERGFLCNSGVWQTLLVSIGSLFSSTSFGE